MAFQSSWIHRFLVDSRPSPVADLSDQAAVQGLASVRPIMDLSAAYDRGGCFANPMDLKDGDVRWSGPCWQRVGQTKTKGRRC